MLAPAEELGFFEDRKSELCARYPGQFALIVGQRLLGVHASLDDAIAATAEALDAGRIAPGAQILVSEIAERPRLRLVHERRDG